MFGNIVWKYVVCLHDITSFLESKQQGTNHQTLGQTSQLLSCSLLRFDGMLWDDLQVAADVLFHRCSEYLTRWSPPPVRSWVIIPII